MLGICKSAKSIPRKPQTRYAQTVAPSGNNADSQTPSITKTPADVDKYIYISELVLVTVFSSDQVVDFIDSEINL